jgi:hypothetical protein
VENQSKRSHRISKHKPTPFDTKYWAFWPFKDAFGHYLSLLLIFTLLGLIASPRLAQDLLLPPPPSSSR